MDLCVNTTSDSFIYRCSDYGVYKYSYADSEVCTGPVSVTSLEGCDEDTNYYYDVDGCSEAQGGNTSSCKYLINGGSAYPLDRCYNAASGNTASYSYSCDANGDVIYSSYTERDCAGTASTSLYNHTLYNINCGTKDCGVTLTRYTSSITCNYENSPVKVDTRETSCNYFEPSNGNAYPINVCFASQQGYAITSAKYKCANDRSEVQLWTYLGNANCEGSGYLSGTYASSNYTFYCGGNTCEHKYRQYSSCTNKYEYDDVPIIWNQCMKYYNQSDNDEPSYNDMIYFINSCKSGYKVVYYFTDPDCKYSNVYYITNTTEEGDCAIEITGCTSTGSGSKIVTNLIISFVGLIFLSLVI